MIRLTKPVPPLVFLDRDKKAPMIRPGDAVLARNAYDQWLEGIATSGTEGAWRDGKKVHDFPVVWVKFTTKGEPLPWPAEDVKLAPVAALEDQPKLEG